MTGGKKEKKNKDAEDIIIIIINCAINCVINWFVHLFDPLLLLNSCTTTILIQNAAIKVILKLLYVQTKFQFLHSVVFATIQPSDLKDLHLIRQKIHILNFGAVIELILVEKTILR